VSLLPSRLFPAGLSQTLRLRFFQAVAGRRLAAVLAVLCQLSAKVFDLILQRFVLIPQCFVLRFQGIDPIRQRLNALPQKLQLCKQTNDEFIFFRQGKFRVIRQTFDHLVSSYQMPLPKIQNLVQTNDR
jgi:hypothetical protein